MLKKKILKEDLNRINTQFNSIVSGERTKVVKNKINLKVNSYDSFDKNQTPKDIRIDLPFPEI